MKGLLANLRIALAALAGRKLRTALTTLGILIGIAAVVVVTALSAGARQEIGGQIDNLGANIVFVWSRPVAKSGVRVTAQGLTERDADAIRREVTAVAAVTSWSSKKAQVVSELGNSSVDVMGVDEHYLGVRDFSLASGRMWTSSEAQAKAKVALIGETTRENLFGDQDPVGRWIRIGKHPVQVIGLLGPKGRTPWEDQDDRVLVPIGAWRSRISPTLGDRVGMLMARARSAERVDTAVRQIDAVLAQRHGVLDGDEPDYRVRSQAELKATQDRVFGVLTALLLSVAGVALFVGGVGVMNIMLVSVAERTREIGVRMAIGARSADIQAQFLIESVMLSTFGGLGGLGAALLVIALMKNAFGWAMSLEPRSVLVALGVSTAIGLLFGFVPARRAAALDPIEALRHE